MSDLKFSPVSVTYHLLALADSGFHVISLSLTFIICKVESNTFLGCFEAQVINTCRVFTICQACNNVEQHTYINLILTTTL